MAKKQTQDRRFIVRRETRPVAGKGVYTGKWAVADLREARGW